MYKYEKLPYPGPLRKKIEMKFNFRILSQTFEMLMYNKTKIQKSTLLNTDECTAYGLEF
jgi:hypothetical protein